MRLELAVLYYLCFLFSLSVHEAAHAAMANRCGDPTGRLLGRMTLNPIRHMDPIGTFLMPLLMLFSHIPFLFGWAKPVPFNPLNLKNFRRDPVFIALAGPVANIFLAIIFIFLTRTAVIITHHAIPPMITILFSQMIILNLVLAFFNIIPVPPLDGHHVLYYFLPENGKRMIEQIGPFGIIIAIFLARPILTQLYPVFEIALAFAFGTPISFG